jgi:hypothetical protein
MSVGIKESILRKKGPGLGYEYATSQKKSTFPDSFFHPLIPIDVHLLSYLRKKHFHLRRQKLNKV